MRRRTGNLRLEGGFTLVEMMVAIAILGLFMTVSMGAIRIASKSTSAGIDRADTTEEMRAVADFLRRHVAHIPRLTLDEGGKQRLAFSGQSDRVIFVAPAPQFASGAGLVVYTLSVAKVEGIEYLALGYAPFDPAGESIGARVDAERKIISTGFPAISIEYFGAQKERQRAEWRDSWAEDAELYPRAIRVRTRADGRDGGWPDLLLPLRSGEGV